MCNRLGCAQSKPINVNTDESEPKGAIQLDAQAAGSNQIQLKWYSSPADPLEPNGLVLFAVYVNGPFLLDLTMEQKVEYLKSNKPITQVLNLNLLNTTVLNTKYGLLDRILAYSTYFIQVNASNTKGYLLSNIVKVETLKTSPELLLMPQLVKSESRMVKVEWYDPMLINSDDRIIFFKLAYRRKFLWNSQGLIPSPDYEQPVWIYATRTLATQYTLENLTPHTAYSFQLIATNSYGECRSEWSEDYLTAEEPPLEQAAPSVLNYTATSVYLAWSVPRIANGIIIAYKLTVFEYQSKLNRICEVKQFNLSNTTNVYNVTSGLEPFSYYLFTIEACNRAGCASSKLVAENYTTDPTFVRTDIAKPANLSNLTLTSSNSYSIDVNWLPPLKPNGQIIYFILERYDYSVPLSIQIKNTEK